MFDFRIADFAHGLKDTFHAQGYHWIADGQQFRKILPNGFTAVVISPTHYDDEVIVEVSLGVRHHLIEQFVGENGRQRMCLSPHSFTLIITIGKQIHLPYKRLRASTAKQLQEVQWQMESYLQDKGFQLLTTMTSLDEIHHILNSAPAEPSPFVNNQWLRCFRGLAVAHMVHYDHIDELANTYQYQLERTGAPPPMIDEFERFFFLMNTHSLN